MQRRKVKSENKTGKHHPETQGTTCGDGKADSGKAGEMGIRILSDWRKK